MPSVIQRMFDNRSKDEKERDYDAFSQRVFPFGDEQKNKVGDLLETLFPKEKRKYLLLHYILIKDPLTLNEKDDYELIEKKANKRKVVKITPEFKAAIKALVLADLAIDENLNYPTPEELLEESKKYL
jgi:hypothetical protein